MEPQSTRRNTRCSSEEFPLKEITKRIILTAKSHQAVKFLHRVYTFNKGKISDFGLKEISKNREYGTILRTIL